MIKKVHLPRRAWTCTALLILFVSGLWLNVLILLARGARIRRPIPLAPNLKTALHLGGCGESKSVLPASIKLPSPAPDAPELCFIMRVIPSHVPNLPGLIFTLASTSESVHTRFILVRTYATESSSDDGLDAAVSFLNSALNPLHSAGGEPRVSVAPIDATYTSEHFPAVRDYGYVLTDLVLEGLLARRAKEKSFCSAVVVTNGDNLYTSGFVPAVAEAMRGGSELVGFHFVSRYNFTAEIRDSNWRAGYGPLRLGSDVEYQPNFKPYAIDLGAMAFTADLLQRSGSLFVLDRLRKDPSGQFVDFITADGRFAKALAADAVEPTIIPRVLYIHQ